MPHGCWVPDSGHRHHPSCHFLTFYLVKHVKYSGEMGKLKVDGGYILGYKVKLREANYPKFPHVDNVGKFPRSLTCPASNKLAKATAPRSQ